MWISLLCLSHSFYGMLIQHVVFFLCRVNIGILDPMLDIPVLLLSRAFSLLKYWYMVALWKTWPWSANKWCPTSLHSKAKNNTEKQNELSFHSLTGQRQSREWVPYGATILRTPWFDSVARRGSPGPVFPAYPQVPPP